ncbi:MAG: MBL fold metallo-hydrolase [Campylobacterales bacterium]|nr:MBL fold metallo-hydrolase [Campylobacterales bacterium]
MIQLSKIALSATAALLLLSSSAVASVYDSNKIVQEAKNDLKIINTQDLVTLLKKNPNTKIIDVRTKGDILKQGGFIKANKVINIPRDKLEFVIDQEVDLDETFVVHCYTGNISALASKRLKELGFKNVLYYEESFKGWSDLKLPTSSLDRYPESFLYRPIEKVAEGVYTSIGQTSPGSYENSGHNNNLGFVIGDKYVAVWNASSSYLLAKALHEEIKRITDKPIKYVILENSQGHAMLGSNYWKEQGATIIAQEIAKTEIEQMGQDIFKRYQKTQKDKFLGTKVVLPDVTFKDTYSMDLGNKVIEAKYFGYAHEHSDIVLWLPKEKIVFAGDIAFNQRLLPIFKITQTNKWLEAWEKFEKLQPSVVVPGHGDVTDIATTRKYTKDYLSYLRNSILKIIEDGGTLNDAYNIDMSAYEHLDTFRELGKQNIAILFTQLEFE